MTRKGWRTMLLPFLLGGGVHAINDKTDNGWRGVLIAALLGVVAAVVMIVVQREED